jgi:hypothetical protein
MTEPTETVNNCEFCGGSSPMTRQVTDGRFSSICRDCLEKTTATHTQILKDWGVLLDAEVTQGPVEAREDAETVWARFDNAFSTFSTLKPIMRMMAEEKDPLDYQWDGGPVDEPQTRMMNALAMIRSLLERHGYREVNVVTGNGRELWTKGELGRFYAYGGENDGQPHWTAKIVFQKV